MTIRFRCIHPRGCALFAALSYSTLSLMPNAACGQLITPISAPPITISDDDSNASDTQRHFFDGGANGNNFGAGAFGVVREDGTVLLEIPAGALFSSVLVDVGSVVRDSTMAINSPPTMIGDDESIGSDTHLNVFDDGAIGNNFSAGASSVLSENLHVNIFGGSVGRDFRAFAGSQVTISGGSVGDVFWARDGSQVAISGGSLGGFFRAHAGSQVAISGGSAGNFFRADAGSQVTISGGEFRLDGVPVEGLESVRATVPFEILAGALFSGVLADGTPFAFSSTDNDDFATGTLTLEPSVLPPVGPLLIRASTDPVPLGIRQGQTLLVDAGSVVGANFNAGLGGTVTIEAGGILGSNLEAVGAEVTILGGSVGGHFDAFTGSQVTISGGSVGDFFRVHAGSQVTISGGSVGNMFRADAGSQVTIAGGSVGDFFQADAGSQVTISGGEFRLDGVPVEGLESAGATVPLEIPAGALLSGVLADGTPFAFSSQDVVLYSRDADDFATGTLTLESRVLPPVGPALITASTDPVPLGIREGQTLVVDAGSMVGDNFSAGLGGTVTIEEGGMVGRNLEVVGAEVTISGGSIGQFCDIADGSRVTISGGSIGWFFEAFDGSVVIISGGSVGGYFVAADGSQVTISGGSIEGPFLAYDGSRVNLIGTEFFIDGTPIANLTAGDPFLVTDRDVTLTGQLRDGYPFSFSLNSQLFLGDWFSPDAILTVTLVPEPSSIVLAIVAALICGYCLRTRTIPKGSSLISRSRARNAFHRPR